METVIYSMFGVSAILIGMAVIAYLTKYPTGAGGAVAATWTADKAKKVAVPILMFVGLNFLIWLVTREYGAEKDLLTLYAGLNVGLLMMVGLFFLPIKNGLKNMIGVLLVMVIIFTTTNSFKPNQKQKAEAEKIQSLAPLELSGWRGSHTVIAPPKGTKPSEWSRPIVSRPGQEVNMVGVESEDFIASNSKNKAFTSSQAIVTNNSLGERTFRLQSTNGRPVKVMVIWETK